MQVYEQSRVSRVGQVEADKQTYARQAQDLDAARARLEKLRTARTQEIIQSEIDAAKLDRLYTRSSNCTDANRTESRTLCQNIAKLQGELASAMTAGEIKDAIASETAKEAKAERAVDGTDLSEITTVTDPGTQGIANLFGVSLDEARRGLAFFFAFLIEVIGGAGAWVLTGGHLPALRKSEFPDVTPIKPHSDNVTITEPEAAPHPVAVWASTCTVKRKGTWTFATECWQAFNAWAAQNGHAPLDQTAFGIQITDLKVERGKRGGKTIYQSFALLPAKPQLRVVR